jgi:hypothetical protein
VNASRQRMRTRAPLMPRPAPVARIEKRPEPVKRAPVTPLQVLREQGNWATSRWLTSVGATRLDVRGERAADVLAQDLRSGAASSRGWRTATPSGDAGTLKPGVQTRVRAAISTRGVPLPRSLRERAERSTGLALGEVQVHADASAAAAAEALRARAFAFGPHLVFGAGEYSPTTPVGESLLAHELAHALSQTFGGRVAVQLQGRAHREPFAPVLDMFDTNIRELTELIGELTAVPQQSTLFARELANLNVALADVTTERAATQYLATESASPITRRRGGGGTEERPPAVLPADSGVNAAVYEQVIDIYFGRNQPIGGNPSRHSLAQRRAQLERGITLMRTLRVTVLNLVNGLPANSPGAHRDVTLDVASYYMQCATILEPDAISQMAFLDVFYADPSVLVLYASVREGKNALSDITQNLVSLAAYAGQAITYVGVPDPTLPPSEMPRVYRQLAEMGQWRARLQERVELLGDPPRRAQAIRQTPTIGDAQWFGAVLRYFMMAQPTLALWIPVEQMSEELGRSLYAGTSLLPGEDDRTRWTREMTALRSALQSEYDNGGATGFGDRLTALEPRVRTLLAEIPPELRRRQIYAMVAEQIPFLFVGGAVAGGVGRFVGGISNGSRWLMAIAEGVTLTVLGAMAMPASSRPTTATGWALQLALNIGFARVGRALFEVGADVARGMGTTRGVLVRAGVEVVLPTAVMASIQTGVQLIEAQATAAGGETNITEMLTVNLVMNALGVMCGALMNTHAPGGRTPTAAELARSASVEEPAAQRWLDMAQRFASYAEEFQRLNLLARRGTLTAEEFATLKENGLSLADDMAATLPDLAAPLGLGRTPAEIRAAIGLFRARIAGLTYTPRPTVTALLPEYTAGLSRVNSVTFVYDPARPPRGLGELRAALSERGYTVAERPGGGFTVADAAGRIIAQVMPAGASSRAALPVSLETAARGPQAQAGLARVRAQTTAPLLESLLAQAVGGGANATMRVLQVVGRAIEPTDANAWRGLANYLTRGGNIAVLARTISHPSSVEFSPEALQRAQTRLRAMVGWDASAVRGLAILYELRPRITGERVDNLFFHNEPEQLVGILQTLDHLAPISRGLERLIPGLTSDNIAQQRGAMGALTSASQLAEQFPGRLLAFEEPIFDDGGRLIRVQDINVIERVTETIAGETRTVERTLFSYEIKEISTASLGRRGPHQFAVDMLLDSIARARVPVPAGTSRPFFETFRWRIRRTELAARAARNLGTTDTSDPRIDAEMRRLVEGMLVRGFDDPILNTMSSSERSGYQAAFTGVPFVEFF